MDKHLQYKIESMNSKLMAHFSVMPYIGSELEFYLTGNDAAHNICLADILKTLAESQIDISKLEKESGENQYEIALTPLYNCIQAISNIYELKKIVGSVAAKYNITASFAAKPYENQPGSALHINLSLVNSSGQNLFSKKHDDPETEYMIYSVGGLLDTMLANMVYFAPNDCSYLRYTSKKNDNVPEDNPNRTYNNAPVNVSWGSNNRTTAIRIPASTHDADSRHIEHRVSGADADPGIVLLKILEGICHGLKNKISPPEKIFGNAFDEQYNFLIPLPKTLDEAKKYIDSYTI